MPAGTRHGFAATALCAEGCCPPLGAEGPEASLRYGSGLACGPSLPKGGLAARRVCHAGLRDSGLKVPGTGTRLAVSVSDVLRLPGPGSAQG